MANGYCPRILQHVEAIARCNPAKKLSPLGFTRGVLASMDNSVSANINVSDAGHVKNVDTSFRKRPLKSSVSDTPSACDVAVTPAKEEFSLPSLLYREVSIYVPDSLIRQYCKDASERVKIQNNEAIINDQGETNVMREVYDILIEHAGALMASVNEALVTQASTQFGKNLVTGSNAARALTFDLGSNGMQDAFVQLMSDIRENEFCDDIYMIGNGDFSNLDLIRKWFANAAADNGLNKANMLASFPEVFADKDTRAIWGANNIGVYEKGSLALITYDKYVQSFSRTLANSEYFTMAFPVNEFCCPQDQLDKMNFDVQIREIDCPTSMTVNGVDTTVSQGVQIIMSKNFSLWQRPANLYHNTDTLYGTNGALRYQITSS